MPDTNAAHWDNYWQGRASHQTGNALVEVGIENNHALKKFWTDTFSQQPKSIHIVDFACGAGSVLEHANELGFSKLTGIDVSQKALDVMMKKIPTASGICSHVDKVPSAENSADLVVSQFGVEYAGNRMQLFHAFQEMRRILKPGGEIIIVAHAKNSVIYEGCNGSLKNAQLIQDSKFLDIAKKTTLSLHENPNQTKNSNQQKLMGRLNQSAEPIMAWLRVADRSKDEFAKFAYHLLESSHKLITNHAKYSKAESAEWFVGIHAELEAYKGRMSSMTTAALSEEEITDLTGKLSEDHAQLVFSPLEKLYFPPNKKLAAWIIRASKSS